MDRGQQNICMKPRYVANVKRVYHELSWNVRKHEQTGELLNCFLLSSWFTKHVVHPDEVIKSWTSVDREEEF